ncbi:vicilin-like seed storage protein At2g18540 [Brachypodium distachyon]|uniref:Cupin type-1 domain-containing protein n=1 Tax=Brachypodium distachyon TaxID=15368 RepID=I1H8K5_BRADI|nr:vicilin-like seed storage protein At2g18540 [Brachypodium distachyon]KQK23112.1 hypothetical protein BRADI_1g71350v3 [Brachypodium distachyon]|eukprot:XP_024312555.1 vicilin-like seed storage protein At2g18540 [Brachypodium distachyon]
MATATARWLVLLLFVSAASAAAYGEEKWNGGATVGGMVVEKERRRVVAASEAGTVTAADVADDAAGTVYRLQFVTMEPGSLFLPVELHADMVFYVHSGRGKVTYIQEGGSEASALEVERGDVYNLEQGTILYIQSYPNATRERLRIYAIFSSSAISSDDPSHPTSEAYSNVSNLLKGFEVEILRRGFGVPTEVVEPIKSAPSPPLIIPYNPKGKEQESSNWAEEIFDAFWGIRDPQFLNKKKKKSKDKKDKDKKSKDKTFNFYSGEPDVKNCHGWSKTMTNEDLQNLRESNIGMFMVNLTTGSMMGPHWNPKATEIAIVTHGSGIVQTVCPSSPSGEGKRGPHEKGGEEIKCKNSLFRVKEGDVFVVPRFHPMAQMSFNNDSFVFVGFSTHMGQNHPQFLAGKLSALQVIGKEILALSLGQDNSTAVEKLLSAQSDSTILTCVSCAEELEKKVEQEEQEREKEKREREEEERRKKEEEEERKRKEEEEEKARKEEEERRKEEEKARREEEERRRREEEEEKRRKEEERGREEEEEKRRKEEERARQEEEERRRREEEERARREEEERKREEEKAKKEEEERARREQKQEEEERARREQEAQEEAKREQEEIARREQEERARREQEEEERRRREQEGGGGGGGDEPSEEEEGRRKQEEGGRGREDEPRKEDEGGDWGDLQNHTAKKLRKRYSLRKGAVLQSA